ncbi:unnamed protein product [marine sediment metagenome]|uniref:Uncharacterized protein n=1 Tax=marine sediment metagenome TaxID=412755 RepID=X1BY66_9ZZZZ
MVVCRYYRAKRGKGGSFPGPVWSFFMHFHPQCWIDQAIAALESKPVVETRGRKKLPMADEVRAARLKILMRRAAVTQRIRIEMAKVAGEQNIDRIIHLGGELNKLKEEIEPLGGVPESWR